MGTKVVFFSVVQKVVGLPELETKIAIIKKKCELVDMNLNSDIITYIADNIDEDLCVITSIITYASFLHQEITLDVAKTILNKVRPVSVNNTI